MNPELLKLLVQLGLQTYQALKALDTEDPVAFEAALKQIGDHHKAALDRLDAAAKP